MADVLSKLAVVITANTAQMTAQLKTANKSLGVMQSTLTGLQTQLVGAFGAYQVIGAIKKSIGIIADFEKQMDKVRAITGATGKDFDALEKNALDLGKSTEYTARQIAGLQVEYGRLGFSTKEILNSTKATLNLATATGEDLTRSAEIAGSTLRAFQLDAREMGRVTDVITGALNSSALALDSFADGMKYVAPVAEATNVSLEETSALLSVLADVGIKGSQAGTSLRRIFTLLTKDGGTLQERLAELAKTGITLAGANDEVGLYAQTALLAIVKQFDKVNELTKSFYNLNGETERTSKIMRDNLSGDFDRFTSAIEGLILEGSKMTPVFRSLTQAATDFFTVMADRGFVSAVLRTGFLPGFFGEGLEDVAKEIEAARKLQEKADKVRDEALTKRAQRALDLYGIDNLGEIAKQFEDGEELYKRALEITTEAIKKKTQELLKATEAQIAKNKATEKAAELAKKAAKEAFELSELERGARIATFERSQKTPQTFESFASTKLKGIDTSFNTSVAASYDSITEAIKRANDAAEDNNKAINKQNASYLRLASSASDAIASGISGEKNFAQVLAGTTASIVDSLERQALAAIIANSSRIPVVGIAAAVAGFAAVKGLFAKISRSGSGSAGGSTDSSRVNGAGSVIPRGGVEGIQIGGTFRIEGKDLVAAVEVENRRSNAIKN